MRFEPGAYRVELHAEFDPRPDYELTVGSTELTDVERNAAMSPDDVELDLDEQ